MSVYQVAEIRRAVRVVSTTNGSLASDYAAGQTVDGVTLAIGDRILLAGQTDGSENGVYVVHEGAPTRAPGFDEARELQRGTVMVVLEGTENARTVWAFTTPPFYTLGETDLTFELMSGATSSARALSLSALKLLGTSQGKIAYLAEDSRQGWFRFDPSDLSAEVTADTQEGIYVAPSSDATGASGAWVRQFSGSMDPKWFGAAADGVADDLTALQAYTDFVISQGFGEIYLPDGEYNLGPSNEGILYINETGDASGEGVDGITLRGQSRWNTQVNGIVSFGFRDIENGNQVGPAGEKNISNYSKVADLFIVGGLELYGLQNASVIDTVRVHPRSFAFSFDGMAWGITCLFCNSITLIASRANNGHSDAAGWLFDTCGGVHMIGGGANSNLVGMRFAPTGRSGSTGSSSPRLLGVYIEGNEKRALLTEGGRGGYLNINVSMNPASWDGVAPAVQIGTASNGTDAISIRDSGFTSNDAIGTAIHVVNCLGFQEDNNNFVQWITGIQIDGDVREYNIGQSRFYASVATPYDIDAGARASYYVSSGSFTPEVTFGTEGDLSVSYTTQSGRYVRTEIDSEVWVDVHIKIVFQPTFSSSSGLFRVLGLPESGAASDDNANALSFVLQSANLSLPTGCTQFGALVSNGASSIQVRAMGDNASDFLEAAEFSSGATYTMLFNGRYLAS